MKSVITPLTAEVVQGLRVGEQVSISGVIYTARDAAHKRLMQALDRGESLPFDLKGQTLYYMGPSPAKPGQVIGSAGPTTSGRLDAYTPGLIAAGLRAMIGKGSRSPEVKESMREHQAVYFAAIAGAGALVAKTILSAEVIAYSDLGPEAILRLEIKDFPAIVVNDIYGGDMYQEGKARYRK